MGGNVTKLHLQDLIEDRRQATSLATSPSTEHGSLENREEKHRSETMKNYYLFSV